MELKKNDEAGAIIDPHIKKCFTRVFTKKIKKYNKVNRKSSMVMVFFYFFTLPPILWK